MSDYIPSIFSFGYGADAWSASYGETNYDPLSSLDSSHDWQALVEMIAEGGYSTILASYSPQLTAELEKNELNLMVNMLDNRYSFFWNLSGSAKAAALKKAKDTFGNLKADEPVWGYHLFSDGWLYNPKGNPTADLQNGLQQMATIDPDHSTFVGYRGIYGLPEYHDGRETVSQALSPDSPDVLGFYFFIYSNENPSNGHSAEANVNTMANYFSEQAADMESPMYKWVGCSSAQSVEKISYAFYSALAGGAKGILWFLAPGTAQSEMVYWDDDVKQWQWTEVGSAVNDLNNNALQALGPQMVDLKPENVDLYSDGDTIESSDGQISVKLDGGLTPVTNMAIGRFAPEGDSYTWMFVNSTAEMILQNVTLGSGITAESFSVESNEWIPISGNSFDLNLMEGVGCLYRFTKS